MTRDELMEARADRDKQIADRAHKIETLTSKIAKERQQGRAFHDGAAFLFEYECQILYKYRLICRLSCPAILNSVTQCIPNPSLCFNGN